MMATHLLIFFLAAFAFCPCEAQSETDKSGTKRLVNSVLPIIQLTESEKQFLNENPVITLGSEKEWEPYVIQKSNGSITGYDADVLERINQLTGANFQLLLGNWREMQDLAKQKKIDGLSTGGIHPEREVYLNFSDIYISLKKYVLVPQGNPKGINRRQDLEGKRIVVHKGNLVDEKLARKFQHSEIVYASSVQEMLQAVVLGKADATFGNAATEYMAAKTGMAYLEHAFELEDSLELAFGIRKDWSEAISIINKGIRAISDVELNKLKQKWFIFRDDDTTKDASKPLLTQEQIEYLSKKQLINLCIDNNWLPLEHYENGAHKGMVADIHRTINDRLELNTRIVTTISWQQSLEFARDRKCDVLTGAASTASRREYMDFTPAMFSFPLVVAGLNERGYIGDFNNISERKFAVTQGYAAIELLRGQYADLEIVEVSSMNRGLKMVREKKVYGYIDSSASIGHYMRSRGEGDIKVIAQLSTQYHLAIATRNDEPILNTIYTRGLEQVSPQERKRIVDHWIFTSLPAESVKIQTLYRLVALFIVLMISMIIWFKYRESIEAREKKSLLAHYSKHSSIGEMVGSIAHQWRQPLAEISSKLMFLDTLARMEKTIPHDQLGAHIKESQVILDHMGETIETFMSFYKTDREKREFNFKQVIEDALLIVNGSLSKEQIQVHTKLEDINYFGHAGLFSQVMMILLSNAKNAAHGKQDEKRLKIELSYSSGIIRVNVEDNFGGIKIDPKKVFDNNISGSKENAGVGLYIAKKLIRESFFGEIYASNTPVCGALFTIEIPAK